MIHLTIITPIMHPQGDRRSALIGPLVTADEAHVDEHRWRQESAPMRIGQVIHKYRIVSEIDQKVMAQEIGISASTLSRLERGDHTCDAHALAAILRWLLTTPEP